MRRPSKVAPDPDVLAILMQGPDIETKARLGAAMLDPDRAVPAARAMIAHIESMAGRPLTPAEVDEGAAYFARVAGAITDIAADMRKPNLTLVHDNYVDLTTVHSFYMQDVTPPPAPGYTALDRPAMPPPVCFLPCAVPGCGRPVWRQSDYCPEHDPSGERQAPPDAEPPPESGR